MESPTITFFTVSGTVFIFSFVILVILCRYKSIRKNATRYVKKLTRADIRHKELELAERRSGLVKRFLRPSGRSRAVSEKCQQLLDMCNGLDLTSDKLSPLDIQKIYSIIQMAQNITEESDDWSSLEGREKAGLLEKRTARLLQQVATAMASMESRLTDLKGSSGEEISTACSYQNSLII